MYIVVLSKIEPRDFSDYTDVLEYTNFTMLDLLQLTFSVWKDIELCDYENVRLSILSKLSDRYFRSYSDLEICASILMSVVQKLYDLFSEQLNPILEKSIWGSELKLERFLHHDMLLKVESPVDESR